MDHGNGTFRQPSSGYALRGTSEIVSFCLLLNWYFSNVSGPNGHKLVFSITVSSVLPFSSM